MSEMTLEQFRELADKNSQGTAWHTLCERPCYQQEVVVHEGRFGIAIYIDRKLVYSRADGTPGESFPLPTWKFLPSDADNAADVALATKANEMVGKASFEEPTEEKP